MPAAHEPLRCAAANLVTAVLAALAEKGAGPRFVLRRDYRSWKRSQQEVFLGHEHELWQHPVEFSSRDWWCSIPEYQALRAVVSDHEVVRTRLDTLVGFPSSLVRRQLDTVVVQYLLTPVVEATRTYRFDRAPFEAAYAAFETGLLVRTVRLVEYVPLLGFDMSPSLAGTSLPGGLTVRPMSDVELSEAVRVMGIPIGQFTSTNSFILSRFHQNALVLERGFPVHTGSDQHPDAATPSPFDDAARHMITALRVVCGGSVTYGRPMRLQNQEDFDAHRYASAILTEVHHPVEDRPTLLVDRAKVEDLHEVYALLNDPRILGMRFLQNALRRLVSCFQPQLEQVRYRVRTAPAAAASSAEHFAKCRRRSRAGRSAPTTTKGGSARQLGRASRLVAAGDHQVSVALGVEGGGLHREPDTPQLRHEVLVPVGPDGQPLRAGSHCPIRLDLGDYDLEEVFLLPALLDLPVVADDRIAVVAADESITDVYP